MAKDSILNRSIYITDSGNIARASVISTSLAPTISEFKYTQNVKLLPFFYEYHTLLLF